MSNLPAPLFLKRKQPDTSSPSDSLTEHERLVYRVVKSKENMGIWIKDVKREVTVPDSVITKCVKTLVSKKLIKEVVNIKNRGKKFYMGVEFEPSTEISGGTWYDEGILDSQYIHILKEQCLRHLKSYQIATTEMVTEAIRRSGVLTNDCSTQQIGEIMRALVLDNMALELKSTGGIDFGSIPPGMVCFKRTNKSRLGDGPKLGAMASIPCGVCPRISMCTPDGIISPMTCEYYKKWLDF